MAVLVGRNAPLALVDPRERATHASNVYDFFKPDHTVEYPVVDGALSQVCYYRALEDCYSKFCDKVDKLNGVGKAEGGDVTAKDDDHFHAEAADYFVFHAPYNKLVQKSFGRLVLLDARRKYAKEGNDGSDPTIVALDTDDKWLTKPLEETYADKGLEKVLKQVSAQQYKQKLYDSNRASQLVGNTYTASVFLGIASLMDRVGGRGDLKEGQSIGVFSYGSGALATMYRLTV